MEVINARVRAQSLGIIFPEAARAVSIGLDHKARQRHSTVGRVMVDALRGETLAGLIHFHRLDGPDVFQLIDDEVALDIRIRSRGMGDLERETRQGVLSH